MNKMIRVSDEFLDWMTNDVFYVIAFLLGAMFVLIIDVLIEAHKSRKAAREEEEWWQDGE